MQFLVHLWLPILLSSVLVFIVSSVIHMCLPVHKGDVAKLPGEEDVLEALRSQGVPPGEYLFPFPGSMKAMGSPEMIERYRRGPVGRLTVVPNGPPALGKSLLQWFLYTIVIGVCVAYVAALGLVPGADFVKVLRVTGTAAFLGYAFSTVHDSIWRGLCWGTTLKFVLDGLIYALATAFPFALLWPGGS